jgi:DNA-binding NtrC family response regulator
MSDSILLIDDEDLFREDLASLLRHEGFICRTAGDGEEGLRLAQEDEPDVVLCDLMMPGVDGIEVTDRLATLCPGAAVILVTAFGNLETAVEAFRKGAADYLLKPLVLDDLLRKILRCVEERCLRQEVRYLRRTVAEAGTGTTIVGDSSAMQEVKELIRKVAPAESTVLTTGESGTGKELVARALHEGRGGSDRPFVPVNCAALPRDLFESELFGHVRGAFTGAIRDRPGYFELARGGTLFLDEIAELPLELQPKLLRVVEQREMLPVGGTRTRTIEVRLVAATNRDLADEVAAGRFREDLFYRVRVLEIRLPALREHREDIPSLVEHLVRRLAFRLGRKPVPVDHAAMQILMSATWRGNVRELDNVLERAMLLGEADAIGVADLPAELAGTAAGIVEPTDDLKSAVRSYERRHIEQVLSETGGNREEAARRLGIDASTLYRRLKDFQA